MKAFYLSTQISHGEIQKYEFLVPPEKFDKEGRKKEFLLGRLCAQTHTLAFADLKNMVQIPQLDSGVPRFPQGFVGSISHSKDYALAAFSAAAEIKSIGVDVERIISPSRWKSIERRILTQKERSYLKQWSGNENEKMKVATLIFSTKESLYKMVYPLMYCSFGFGEAQLQSVDFEKKTYKIQLKSHREQVSPFNGVYGGYFHFIEKNLVTLLIS